MKAFLLTIGLILFSITAKALSVCVYVDSKYLYRAKLSCNGEVADEKLPQRDSAVSYPTRVSQNLQYLLSEGFKLEAVAGDEKGDITYILIQP